MVFGYEESCGVGEGVGVENLPRLTLCLCRSQTLLLEFGSLGLLIDVHLCSMDS